MRAIALLVLSAAALPAQRASQWMPDCACESPEARKAAMEGAGAHRLRRLDEASAAYARALKAAPSRDPTAAEMALVKRFAPLVRVHPRDPFPLIDAAAILHPTLPWIAYHFFWQDDIDFPDDNDPCDHELMWVRLDDRRERVAGYVTYFHGRLLEAPRVEGDRAEVVVQWGKHGTMPAAWKSLRIVADRGDVEAAHMPKLDGFISLEEYNRSTWQKLATIGRQAQASPLARGWPLKFPGGWEDFIGFTKTVDIVPLLEEKRYVKVAWFSNAVIDRQFLLYNFSAKTDWPPQVCAK
jgi:hypothetical protein